MSFLNQYCDDVWRGCMWGCSASLCRRINNDYELHFGSVHRASRLIWWGGRGPICAAYWILDTEAETGAWQYQTLSGLINRLKKSKSASMQLSNCLVEVANGLPSEIFIKVELLLQIDVFCQQIATWMWSELLCSVCRCWRSWVRI